jgi:hypothetical protein
MIKDLFNKDFLRYLWETSYAELLGCFFMFVQCIMYMCML